MKYACGDQRKNTGLYDERFEHDACGIGAVVSMKGEKSYRTVDDALKIVEKLEHRAGRDATGETGDGVGIYFKYRIVSFRKLRAMLGLPSAKSATMAWVCSFSRRTF